MFETWGTFSVADHLGPRAFVADVLLYDRLIIPQPDAEERERWIRLGRQPDLLDRKLAILREPHRDPGESMAPPFPWTAAFRQRLDQEYPDARLKARQAVSAEALRQAHDLDRGIIAASMRTLSDVITPEVVPAYTSYAATEEDLKLASVGPAARPDDHLVGAIGWEFFVPDDPALDDDALLVEAVHLAEDKKFRQARQAFHSFRREATRMGASPEQFRRELETVVARYQEQTARARVRTAVLNGFVIVGAGLSLGAALFFPPLGLVGPGLALMRLVVEKKLPAPDMTDETRAVAMFHDARKQFGWHT